MKTNERFLLRVPPELQAALTFNASRGSHRQAVHHNATLFLYPLKEKYQLKKLLSVVSWIGFLASAVSEYGFDVDFPLTPSVWLVIGICVVVMATAHNVSHGSAARSTVGVRALQPDWNCRAGMPDGLPAVRISNSSAHRHATAEKSVVAGFSLRAPITGAATVSMLTTASDAIPAVIFLSPAATRGPPSSDNQIDRTLGRPTRHFCSAPLPSEIHLQDLSSAPNALLNNTDHTPIRSAIEGDQT